MAETTDGSRGGTATLPESFRQRGLAIPFTTRLVSFARYRRGAGGSADALVPGLGGGTDVYIIPFKQLPGLFPLSVYDRALHEQIALLTDPGPLDIRQTALDVAETGLAGPGPMRRAREWAEERRTLRERILFGLIRQAVAQLGDAGAQAKSMDAKTLASPEGIVAARDALKGFAADTGIDAGEIITRLETWADTVLPAGAPDGLGDGPLVRRIDEIEAMANALTQWLVNEPTDLAEMAQRTAMAGRRTAEMARVLVERLHAPAGAMAKPLAAWEDTQARMRTRIDRLAHLVDGWQRILDMWAMATRGDRIHQRDVLEILAPHVPVLPGDLAGGDEFWRVLRESQLRWLKQSRVRVDSDLDSETREKLGQFERESA